jgi:hypothetical protein
LVTEKALLIKANISDLNESNKTKEALINKIKMFELDRVILVNEILISLGRPERDLRLLELANLLGQPAGAKLKMLHSVFDISVRRLKEANQKNDALAVTALRVLNGTVKLIGDELKDKNTYQKKGTVEASAKPGKLMRREA